MELRFENRFNFLIDFEEGIVRTKVCTGIGAAVRANCSSQSMFVKIQVHQSRFFFFTQPYVILNTLRIPWHSHAVPMAILQGG